MAVTRTKKLPMGWREVPTSSIPDDEATPESERGFVSNPHGERVEVMRWQRGCRIVRIVKETDMDGESKESVMFGSFGDRSHQCYYYRELTNEKKAILLMKLGGFS